LLAKPLFDEGLFGGADNILDYLEVAHVLIRAVRLYLKLGKRSASELPFGSWATRPKTLSKPGIANTGSATHLHAGYVRSRPRYSDEQKKVVIDHYLSHGRCAAATLQALGYPSRETLAAWIEELCPESRKRIVGRAVASVSKSQKVKQAAVIELCTGEQSARVVAEKAGASRPTLYNRKNQLLGREVPASMKRKMKPASDHERAELEQQAESLRRDIRQRQLEHDILKKANELIKNGMGINPQLLSNREKTKLVDALKQTYALTELLAALGLARSSYFYHRARLLVADRHADARRVIADIFELNHYCYGYRRIRAALIRQQIFISEKAVRRLMRQEGLAAATTRRRRYGSYRGEISPAPENIINREFYAAAPNQKWLTDLTGFQIPAGKAYLSPVIDRGTRPDAELVNTMLDSATESVAGCKERPVVHSDRGAHYRWPGWLSRMQAARRVARCRAKDVRRTMQPAKASSGDSRRNCFILVIGEPRLLINSSRQWTRTSAGTVRHVSPSAARQAACSKR
jgi:transposase-like protein